jgi:hypothetical protein
MSSILISYGALEALSSSVKEEEAFIYFALSLLRGDVETAALPFRGSVAFVIAAGSDLHFKARPVRQINQRDLWLRVPQLVIARHLHVKI